MNKYIKKYKKIVKKIINNSFLSLKNCKIEICEKENLKFTADASKTFNCFRIRTHPRMRKLSENFLIGILTHELCHLEFFKKLSFFEYIVHIILINLYEGNYIYDEENTDKTAIEKDYAKPLYEYREFRWKDAPEDQKKLYLSPEEIKEYAIKINKWDDHTQVIDKEYKS